MVANLDIFPIKSKLQSLALNRYCKTFKTPVQYSINTKILSNLKTKYLQHPKNFAVITVPECLKNAEILPDMSQLFIIISDRFLVKTAKKHLHQNKNWSGIQKRDANLEIFLRTLKAKNLQHQKNYTAITVQGGSPKE